MRGSTGGTVEQVAQVQEVGGEGDQRSVDDDAPGRAAQGRSGHHEGDGRSPAQLDEPGGDPPVQGSPDVALQSLLGVVPQHVVDEAQGAEGDDGGEHDEAVAGGGTVGCAEQFDDGPGSLDGDHGNHDQHARSRGQRCSSNT